MALLLDASKDPLKADERELPDRTDGVVILAVTVALSMIGLIVWWVV